MEAPALPFPDTSQIVESKSRVNNPSPGPIPASHARPSAMVNTLSNWRTWPQVNERRNVPTVDGAITRNPNTRWVEPDRSRST